MDEPQSSWRGGFPVHGNSPGFSQMGDAYKAIRRSGRVGDGPGQGQGAQQDLGGTQPVKRGFSLLSQDGTPFEQGRRFGRLYQESLDTSAFRAYGSL